MQVYFAPSPVSRSGQFRSLLYAHPCFFRIYSYITIHPLPAIAVPDYSFQTFCSNQWLPSTLVMHLSARTKKDLFVSSFLCLFVVAFIFLSPLSISSLHGVIYIACPFSFSQGTLVLCVTHTWISLIWAVPPLQYPSLQRVGSFY